MRLAEDQRARVPFAVVGIVLLLGSATYAATVAERGPPPTDPDAVEARERVAAAVDTAVRRAAAHAAARAAATPVVEPADTAAGRALGSDPFRNYLELRVYHSVRRALSTITVQVGDVTGTASLPAPHGVDDAVDRVAVERGGPNASVDVEVTNVTIEVARGGRTLVQRTVTVERTVATPALALHDRVERYQSALDAGLTNTSGLATRVAALLHTLAWSRGYMQYAGAPVENVVANRHLAVATNYALLAIQRQVFGRADPAGRAALRRATAVMMAEDAKPFLANWTDTYLRKVLSTQRNVLNPGSVPFPSAAGGAPGPRDDMTVTVGDTADQALARFLGGGRNPSLSDVLQRVYSAQTRYRVNRRVLESKSVPTERPPGEDWRLVDNDTRRGTTVTNRSASVPPTVEEWHQVGSFSRHVNVSRVVRRTWTNGNETVVRQYVGYKVIAVGIVADARPAAVGGIPRRPVRTVHDPGHGPLDGPNLAGIHETVRDRRLADPGRDVLAERAALGTLDRRAGRVAGERPDGLRSLVRTDLWDLWRRIRNVSTRVARGAVASGGANAARELAAALRTRRAELVDVPATYDSVATKARVAARAAFVDAVVATLAARAEQASGRDEGLSAILSEFDLSLGDLKRAMRADPVRPRGGRPLFADGIAGPVNVTVAGAPPYLTRAAVSNEQVRAVTPGTELYPLRTRNINVFTIPSGDAVDVVADAMASNDSESARLRTAASTLRAANRTLADSDNVTLRRKRDALRKGLSMVVADARRRLLARLATVADRWDAVSLSNETRQRVVREAFAGFGSTGTRAIAVANGTLATRVAATVDRTAGLSGRRRAMLEFLLRSSLDRAARSTSVRPPRELVSDTGASIQQVAKPIAKQLSARAFNESFRRLQQRYDGRLKLTPTGLPLAPLPGAYYAVANVWITDVEGTYASFAVSAPGAGSAGPPMVSYRRDGGPVRLDVDGDGSGELLGWSERVSFSIQVPVAVVVPPNPSGIGDTDGNADERSDGWATDPPVVHNRTRK